jgi:ElaB/YqjD/DUF883 family membrane-anchored ribosome-binding protein
MNDATTQKLIDEFRAVIADAEALVAATADDLGERARSAHSKAAETVDRAQRGLDELEAQFKARAKALADEAGGYVRDNPLQSLGLAVAAGVVIGVLLSRR